MPYVQVPPAFSESEIAEALAKHAQTVEMQEEDLESIDLASRLLDSKPIKTPIETPIAFPVPVPVPIPMPLHFMRHFPMPVPAMPVPAMPNNLIPPGYKLVQIPETQKPRKSTISDPADNDRKIFVGGLSPASTETSLVKYFSEFGPVEDATVVCEANKSRGFGFVLFRDNIPPAILEKKHIIDQRRCGVSVAFPRKTER
jgi:hypothetical protein